MNDLILPPEWLSEMMLFVANFPYIGVYVVLVTKWIGFMAAILTVITILLQGLLGFFELIHIYLGIEGKIKDLILFLRKIIPYVKWFSIFNVQKEGSNETR